MTLTQYIREAFAKESIDGDYWFDSLLMQIDKWYATTKESDKYGDEDLYEEEVCFENHFFIHIDKNQLIVWGGGDWQEPVLCVIEVYNGELICRNTTVEETKLYEPLLDKENYLTESDIYLKIKTDN